MNLLRNTRKQQNKIVVTEIGMQKLQCLNINELRNTNSGVNSNSNINGNGSRNSYHVSQNYCDIQANNPSNNAKDINNWMTNKYNSIFNRTAQNYHKKQLNKNLKQLYNTISVDQHRTPANKYDHNSFYHNITGVGQKQGHKQNQKPFNYSKKIQKRHEMFNMSQEKFKSKVIKQLQNRNSQKTRQIEWPHISFLYKDGIKCILKNWQKLNTSQHIRAKQRLREIHKKKYDKNNQKQQKFVNYKQRSFLEPRKSKINYQVSGITTFKAKGNTKDTFCQRDFLGQEFNENGSQMNNSSFNFNNKDINKQKINEERNLRLQQDQNIQNRKSRFDHDQQKAINKEFYKYRQNNKENQTYIKMIKLNR